MGGAVVGDDLLSNSGGGPASCSERWAPLHGTGEVRCEPPAGVGEDEHVTLLRDGVGRGVGLCRVCCEGILKQIAEFKGLKITDIGVEMAHLFIKEFRAEYGEVLEEMESLQARMEELRKRFRTE